MTSCYGSSRFGKLPDCKTCECYAFCADAKDPDIRAVEYNDEIGTLAVDPVFPEEAVSGEEKNEPAYEDVSHGVRLLFGEMIRAVKADPVDFLIIASRMYGLPYEAIGKHCNMSKQAISKRCQNISARSMTIRRFLKTQLSPNPEIASLFSTFQYDLRKNDGNRVDLKAKESSALSEGQRMNLFSSAGYSGLKEENIGRG